MYAFVFRSYFHLLFFFFVYHTNIFFFTKEKPTGFVEAQFQILCLVVYFFIIIIITRYVMDYGN